MTKCRLYTVLALISMAFGTAMAQDVLTNDAVLKMVKAGLGEGVIVSMIESQPGKYSLSPDDLVKLKHDGASDRVLAAMIGKVSTSAPSAASASVVRSPAPTVQPTPLPSVVAVATAAAPAVDLKTIHKIFVDKLDNDLDQYLRAEFFKQMKGKVSVVLEEKDAEAILTGVSEEERGTGAKITGRYLGLHDLATGTLSLLDKDRKTILWSDEAGDRSLIFSAVHRGGERKVAERLIGKLKKAMGY